MAFRGGDWGLKCVGLRVEDFSWQGRREEGRVGNRATRRELSDAEEVGHAWVRVGAAWRRKGQMLHLLVPEALLGAALWQLTIVSSPQSPAILVWCPFYGGGN